MMRSFVFPGLTTRVIFGDGTIARTGEEIDRLGHSRALVPDVQPDRLLDAPTLPGGLLTCRPSRPRGPRSGG